MLHGDALSYLQVFSSDPDSAAMNKAVNYSIETGDHLHMFDIQQSDGSIVVHTQLDREAVSTIIRIYV